jgi:hypothetical protein
MLSQIAKLSMGISADFCATGRRRLSIDSARHNTAPEDTVPKWDQRNGESRARKNVLTGGFEIVP